MNDIHNLPDVHHTSSSTFLSAACTQKVNDQITVEKPNTKKKINPNNFIKIEFDGKFQIFDY